MTGAGPVRDGAGGAQGTGGAAGVSSRGHTGPNGLYVVEHVPAEPDNARVVFVHGTMDRSTSFAKVARRLGDLHVVRYDRRGYGHSRPVGPGTFDVHVDDLVAVLGGRPSVLVGHSLGGTIALAAAVRRPELVVSMAVYEAPVPWLSTYESPPRSTTDRNGDPAMAAEQFMRMMIGSRRWERLPARTQADRRAEGPALVADMRSFREGKVGFDVAGIAVPVVVARGANTSARHRDGTDRLAAALPHATLVVVDGADHGAHLSHAQAFADLVRQAVVQAG